MKKSLKGQIIIYFSILFVAVLIIFAILVSTYNIKIFQRQSYNYCQKIVEENIIIIDNYFGQVKNISSIVASDKDIISAVNYRNSTNENKIDYKIELYNQWKVLDKINQLDVFENITNAVIIGNTGKYLYYFGDTQERNYNFYNQEWFNMENDTLSSKVKFTNIHKTDYLLNGKNKNTVSLIIPILDFSNYNKAKKSYLMCDFDINPILSSKMNKANTQVLIFNGVDPVYFPMSNELSKNQHNTLYKEIQNNNKKFIIQKDKENDCSYMCVNEKSMITGWSIIGLISLKEVEYIEMAISIFIIILSIFSIIIIVLLSMTISNSILGPINRLVNKFKIISRGNFNVEFEQSSIREINTLSYTADNMVQNIINLNKEVVEEHKKTAEAQLKALQHQINPHFLNNVLQSIKALAVCEDVKSISTMTTLLGKILSYSVYNPYDNVTIVEELMYTENYIKLQNIRYNNMLSYEINVEEEVKDIKLPKLVIQPIVENAIEHGISRKKEGHIIISAFKELNEVNIIVSDNGFGIAENKLNLLNEKLQNNGTYSEKRSIGLLNVNERIKSIYGDKCSLKIISIKDEKTIVIISFIL